VERCVECGEEFDPVPWADPDDLICDSCINDLIEAGYVEDPDLV
jgi:hypothetical protein